MPSLPPPVLFIDSLSDAEVGLMLDGDYAEHAMRELQRRADANPDGASVLDTDLLTRWRIESGVARVLDGLVNGLDVGLRFLGDVGGGHFSGVISVVCRR